MKSARKVRTNGWTLKQKCTEKKHGGGGCRALLQMNENGIYHTYTIHSDRPFKNTIYVSYTFKCPICGVESDIIIKKIPFRIRRKIDKKSSEEKKFHVKFY